MVVVHVLAHEERLQLQQTQQTCLNAGLSCLKASALQTSRSGVLKRIAGHSKHVLPAAAMFRPTKKGQQTSSPDKLNTKTSRQGQNFQFLCVSQAIWYENWTQKGIKNLSLLIIWQPLTKTTRTVSTYSSMDDQIIRTDSNFKSTRDWLAIF